MNLIHIAQGWWNYIHGTPQVKQMIAERLLICDRCDYKQLIMDVAICGKCHCPLAGKTASAAASCPLNKWAVWVNPETYY